MIKRFVRQIRNLKQALNQELLLKKVEKLESRSLAKTINGYEPRAKEKTKNDFEKNFLKLMNNAVFGKIIEYVRKKRDIKLVTTEPRKNYLPSYNELFSRICISHRKLEKHRYS